MIDRPALSVAIPTFNNVDVLRRCLDGWQSHAAGAPVELVVVVVRGILPHHLELSAPVERVGMLVLAVVVVIVWVVVIVVVLVGHFASMIARSSERIASRSTGSAWSQPQMWSAP